MSAVTKKGRVTLPNNFRDRLGVSEGDQVINRAMLPEAVRLFKEGSMDFVDACALASAGRSGCTSIATFDRGHFRKGRLPLYWE